MFGSEAVAAAAVDRILASLRPGLERDIFIQVDVQGRSVKEVAAALHISERHLYRVRREMTSRLCGLVELAVSPVTSPYEEHFEAARLAFDRGDARRADAALSTIWEERLSPLVAARAWALKSRIAADLGDTQSAFLALEKADTAYHALAAPHWLARTEIALARSYLAYSKGEYQRAIDLAEAACADADRRVDAFDVREVVRALLYLATIHQEHGTSEAALKALDRAEATLRRLPVPPTRERIQLSIMRATVLSAKVGQLDEAIAHADEALSTARWHGVVTEAIWASYTTAYIHLAVGNAETALPYAAAAISTASNLIEGHHLARMHLMMARLALLSRNFVAAETHIASAKEFGKNHRRSLAISAACETRLHYSLSNSEATIEESNRCLDYFGTSNDSYHKGVAYLARGHARFEAGMPAIDDAECAVNYLERGGMLCDRLDALRLCYDITKNARFLTQASELRQSLTKRRVSTTAVSLPKYLA